jgi:hypothetical protein
MNRYKLLKKLLELAAPGWNITQIKFSIGVRGSIPTSIFGKALSDLGVPAAPVLTPLSSVTVQCRIGFDKLFDSSRLQMIWSSSLFLSKQEKT